MILHKISDRKVPKKSFYPFFVEKKQQKSVQKVLSFPQFLKSKKKFVGEKKNFVGEEFKIVGGKLEKGLFSCWAKQAFFSVVGREMRFWAILTAVDNEYFLTEVREKNPFSADIINDKGKAAFHFYCCKNPPLFASARTSETMISCLESHYPFIKRNVFLIGKKGFILHFL